MPLPNKTIRCQWAGENDSLLQDYHDHEWGLPVHDDRMHFELIILEGAQAGLNWSLILHRREHYRKAYAQFEPGKVARFTAQKQAQLLHNKNLIRNRLKIESSVRNAVAFIKIQQEYGSFNRYIWSFVQGKPIINHWSCVAQVPAVTALSNHIAKELKKKGFSFMGSTTTYAYLQAAGLVNDHTVDCFRHQTVD